MPQNEEVKKTLKALEDLIKETYLIADPYIIKTEVAAAVTQFLASDPAWIVFVAPSGGCKSEFINMIMDFTWTPPGRDPQLVWPLSTLSANTFVSGMKSSRAETSLLLKIGSGIITFKDMTSLLSEQRDVRSVIMGQLREIYDGHYTKAFGTGESIDWEGKITVIAGATYAIHKMRQAYTAMGERFIFYHMIQPDRQAAAKQTMLNQEAGIMPERRKAIAKAMTEYIQAVLNAMPSELPPIDDKTRNNMISLADLATRARSAVERDWSSPKHEITDITPPEMPTRFAGALQAYVQAFKVINYYETGEMIVLPEDYVVLYKMALDSVTNMRRLVMQKLAKYDIVSTTQMATALALPTNTTHYILEDLTALEIVDRSKKGNADMWTIREMYRSLMVEFDHIVPEGSLPADNPADDFDRSKYEGEPEMEDPNIQLDLGGGIR